jgi:putative DNA-invertase from lambdoid prophage Rac
MRAGIEHAKASDDNHRGRKPSYGRAQFEAVRNMLELPVTQIAEQTGLTRQTIDHSSHDPAAAV